MTYIIAEAGVNHNGDINLALDLVNAAADAGADVVKFQTFNAKALVTAHAEQATYQRENMQETMSQRQMLEALELSVDDHIKIIEACNKRNIEFLSTPFELKSLNFLIDELQQKLIKIGSGNLTDAPLLYHSGLKNVGVILSTGMGTLGEIEIALGALAHGYLKSDKRPCIEHFLQSYCSDEGQAILKAKVRILHCTSSYPAPFESVNLRVMDTYKNAFNLEVGFSDHTQGIAVPIAAVARGATIIEKHFTLDKALPGPDHKASLEPDELKSMCESIKQVDLALGGAVKQVQPQEIQTRQVARKKIVAASAIKAGDFYSGDNITLKRSQDGISAVEYYDYIGKKAQSNYMIDEVIDA